MIQRSAMDSSDTFSFTVGEGRPVIVRLYIRMMYKPASTIAIAEIPAAHGYFVHVPAITPNSEMNGARPVSYTHL